MGNLKLLSLFSGVGSFESALSNLGLNYDVVGFSEIDKWAIESYCAIHGVSKSLNLGDISKVNDSKLPYTDLITYAFPCQSISLSGKGEGIKEGTDSGLLFEAERIINSAKPKYAIAENVTSLVSSRYIKDFKSLLSRLDSYGYNSYYETLSAKDFNIPQTRERVFIVSIRKDIDDGSFNFPVGEGLNRELSSVMLDKVDDKYYVDKDNIPVFDKIKGVDLMNYNKPVLTVKEATVKGYDIAQVGDSINISFARSKTRRGRVGKGIAGTLEVRWNQVVLQEDSRIRKLTPLESWRLMGFSDTEYWAARRRLEEVFYNGRDNSDTQMYKQAGNAICVPVLEGIFKNLL